MTRFLRHWTPGLSGVIACVMLLACTPRLDWREVRGTDAPYRVMMPAKPASETRTIHLDGRDVSMTMMGTVVDDVTFAVGSATLPDDAAARHALPAMKAALVRNINGKIRSEKAEPGDSPSTMEVEATGHPDGATGDQPRLLAARFVARGPRVYQLVVTGKENAISHDSIDTFFESFKPD